LEDNFQSAYQEEEDRLNQALTEIDTLLEKLQQTPVYTGHDYTEQVLEANRDQKRKDLAKLSRSLISDGLIFKAMMRMNGRHSI